MKKTKAAMPLTNSRLRYRPIHVLIEIVVFIILIFILTAPVKALQDNAYKSSTVRHY